MPHVFDPDKGIFVQVHYNDIPPRASHRLKKRQRNAEYVKSLLQSAQKKSEPSVATPEELEAQRVAREEAKARREAELARKEEEAQRRKEEEAARRQQAEEKRKAEAEAKRKADEEREAKRKIEEAEKEEKRKAEEAKRKAAEEEAAKKKAEEEAARKKAKEEEAARKKAEEEEEAKRKKAEEEKEAKRKAEEEAAKKKAEEEEAKRKAEEEEEAARKKAAEEEAKRKAEEEEAARIKAAEEEAARKKAAEEEAKRKAEEEAARKKAEEEEAKRKAEEEAARKKAEEEEAKRKAEEEAARKKAAEEEAKRKAEEEAARIKAAEEEAARKKAAEEEAKRKADEEEAARKKAEEEEAKRKAEEEARKKKAEEEEAKRKAEEEARKKKAEEEEAKRKAEEAERKKAEEAEAQQKAEEAEEVEAEVLEKAAAPPAAFEAPKVSATAYRAFESDSGSKMRASAPEFVPGQGGWAVQLAKTNPDAVRARRKAAPPISAASQRLPTYKKKDWILGSVRRNRVTVISGDTGCGKSTLIPQLICDAENLVDDDKVVVCTQPRRIAAITLAQYVSADRGQELGDEVGYQIRFVNAFSEHTRLIYATTAIILRRLHSEPDLESIGCLIVDEVHERDVYTDFVLLLIREAMLAGKMEHLKIVLMSATLKADDFANYFNQVNGELALKPVNVPGRMFNVEEYYWEDVCEWLAFCPPFPRAGGGKGKGKKGGKDDERKGPDDNDLWKVYNQIKECNVAKDRPGAERVEEYGEKALQACWAWKQNEVYIDLIVDLIHFLHKEQPRGDGAILVFLPGWGDISKVFIELYKSGQSFKVIALHSLMTPEQQQEAFEHAPEGMRKVVLSTNIAEASVTIDDVVYVIDSGVRKERSYNPDTGVSSLDPKMVTKANAIQRRGRAGRVQEGMVFHLFPSYVFGKFEEFPLPQMLTSSMEEVVLQSKVICGTSNENISKMLRSSMAAPAESAITNAVAGLKSMDCLTLGGELTALGRACASIPIQPNVAKMLLVAGAFRCIKHAAVVAAFLSVKNPFQQSPGAGQQAKKQSGKDYFNKGFASDHLTCLQAYVEWRQACNRGNGDSFCDEMGLSPETMDMAHMMANQFVNFLLEAGYDGQDAKEEGVSAIKKASTEDAVLRCALTAGLMPSVITMYRGNRSPYWWADDNSEVFPFPGSVNKEYNMGMKDGCEWMVFSDSMVMGRGPSIMDSSLVFSNFVLLFAKAVMLDEKKGEIRFDRWWAKVDMRDPKLKSILSLRKHVLPKFKECIEGRDLSLFPQDLVAAMIDIVKQNPVELNGIEPCPAHIMDECPPSLRRHLSVFEWPQDDADEEEEG